MKETNSFRDRLTLSDYTGAETTAVVASYQTLFWAWNRNHGHVDALRELHAAISECLSDG